MREFVYSVIAAQDGGQVTDHYREAEALSKPRPAGFHGLPSQDDPPAHTGRMLPADLVAAQLHATLAVADQLARIATALERLAGPEPR
jgi:hypothetical protein